MIGIISVAAILFISTFNNSYQGVVDKVSVSEYGRSALNVIAKDIRNSGYRNINILDQLGIVGLRKLIITTI